MCLIVILRDREIDKPEIEKSFDPEVLGTEGLEIRKFILTISYLIFVFSYFHNFGLLRFLFSYFIISLVFSYNPCYFGF